MKDKTRSKRRTPLVSSEEGGLETAPAGTDHSTISPPGLSLEEGKMETAGTDHSTIEEQAEKADQEVQEEEEEVHTEEEQEEKAAAGVSLEEGKMETASARPPRHRRRTPPPRRGVDMSRRTRERTGHGTRAPYRQGVREHRRRTPPTPSPTPAPDFWSKCYLDETCRAADQGRGFGHQRDNCIELECQESGLHYDTNYYIDCGNWHFKGYCSAAR